MSDYLVKAITNGVRVYAAVTTDLVNEAIRRHDCYPVASAALGRTMTGALLMAANLKNNEAITVSFRGDGPLGTVTADASAEGYVRGYVGDPHVDLPLNAQGKLDVGGGIGHGLVTITRFTGLREPVSGSCEIVTGEVAEDLTQYLYVSEQTPSCVGLGVLVGNDLKAIAAGGFIIQPMPDATDEVISKLEENLKNLRPVTSMIKDGLSPHGIIEEIMAGFEMEHLSTTELKFKCQCSRQRIEDMLIALNVHDLEELVADGKAEICCHFCGEKYNFNKEELEHILKIVQGVQKQ